MPIKTVLSVRAERRRQPWIVISFGLLKVPAWSPCHAFLVIRDGPGLPSITIGPKYGGGSNEFGTCSAQRAFLMNASFDDIGAFVGSTPCSNAINAENVATTL